MSQVSSLTDELQTISLHFLSLSPRRNLLGTPLQSEERIVLPILTCLKHQGTSKYLDSFLARLNACCLEVVNITIFNQASQLSQFIKQIEMQMLLVQADLETSTHTSSSLHHQQQPGVH